MGEDEGSGIIAQMLENAQNASAQVEASGKAIQELEKAKESALKEIEDKMNSTIAEFDRNITDAQTAQAKAVAEYYSMADSIKDFEKQAADAVEKTENLSVDVEKANVSAE